MQEFEGVEGEEDDAGQISAVVDQILRRSSNDDNNAEPSMSASASVVVNDLS